MLNKIDIPGTDITLEIVDKTITITNKIEYDMQMHFRNTDESNKRNLFDLCGFKGELQ
ncbi:phage protein [Streptococcus pneumoniae]|nr:phage protein [Streptococcus pneumoniae]